MLVTDVTDETEIFKTSCVRLRADVRVRNLRKQMLPSVTVTLRNSPFTTRKQPV